MAPKGNKKLNSISLDEHDMTEYRKRVATYADGDSVSYENNNFVSGDSPAVLNVFSNLSRNGHKGYLINDGPGSILVEFSSDGDTYGGQHTLKNGEIMILDDLSIKKIRLTYVSDSSYRCLVA
jgi:hypothetical protein